MSEEKILHALDLGMLGEWDEGKAVLEDCDDPISTRLAALFTTQQEIERERSRSHAMMRHEVGNALSAAQVNVAGMADGMLKVTQARLIGVRDALQNAGCLLGEPKRQTESPPGDLRSDVFDICELIAAQVSMLTGLAQAKRVRVTYEPCGLHHAACTNYRGDAVRTGQVLRNILLNAVRYTPPGGLINVLCFKPEGELTLTVADTGPGIKSEDLPHVFEAGYRGANTAASTGQGLGLSVVSKLLKGMGGEAKVLSESDRGATVIIKLPAPSAAMQR